MSEEQMGQEGAGDESQQQQQQQTQQTIDPSQIAAEAAQKTAAAMVAAQNNQVQQQQQQLTPEQIAEIEKQWNPQDDFVNSFSKVITSEEATAEDRRKAFSVMRDGLMQQVRQIVRLQGEAMQQQMKQELTPVQQFAQQQQAQALWGEFSGKYPALKDFQDVAEAVSANLRASGFQPSSREELFKKVAEGTEGLIKRSNPAFVATAVPVGSGMAQTNTMGHAVGGAPSGGGANNSVADVWD